MTLPMMWRLACVAWLMGLAAGCPEALTDAVPRDAAAVDVADQDAGERDAGERDAGVELDAGAHPDACGNDCNPMPMVDAGGGPSVSEACPRVRSLEVTPFTGEPAYLRGVYFYVTANVEGAPSFVQWSRDAESLVQPVRADVYPITDEPLRVGVMCDEGPSVWAQAPDPGAVHVHLALAAPHCPPLRASIAVECPERPMGPEPPPFAGLSLECGRCLLAHCRNVEGIDVVGSCFQGAAGLPFQQQCQTAHVCSTNAPDDCAQDEAGAEACYCGRDVSPEACVDNTTAQGRCVREWETAAMCAGNDARCVLDGLNDRQRPSGHAALALECQRSACASACL